MTWSANRYQKLPPVSLKRVGILTGGGLLWPQGSQPISDPHPWRRGKFSTIVALKSQDIVLTPMRSLAGIVRQVPNDSQMGCTAKSIGICLGQ